MSSERAARDAALKLAEAKNQALTLELARLGRFRFGAKSVALTSNSAALVAQLDPGAGKAQRVYLWAYHSNRLGAGPPLIVFDYQVELAVEERHPADRHQQYELAVCQPGGPWKRPAAIQSLIGTAGQRLGPGRAVAGDPGEAARAGPNRRIDDLLPPRGAAEP